MIWDAIPALIALAGAAWTYGSAGDVRRANFSSWISGHFGRAKPIAAKLLIRTAMLGLGVVAGIIVWVSVREVYEFRTSLEPVTRRDVFHLLMNSFNLLAYASVCYACLLLLISPKRPRRIPLVITEGQPITFTLRGEPDIEVFKESIRRGITVKVEACDGRLNVAAENIDGFSFQQH